MPFAKVNFGLIAYCVGDVLRSQIALRFTEDLNGQNPGLAEDVVQPRLRSRKSPLPE
jgi:hypothetical protein